MNSHGFSKSKPITIFIIYDKDTYKLRERELYVETALFLLQVTDSYFYQTNTALYPVKSENSPTTADDR